MCHLIGIEYTKVVEFIVVIAGHFPDQRTFSVHHLVVAQGQNKILGKRVGHGERERVVVSLTVQRIERHIPQHIVHPAHVPLEQEPQSPVVVGLCDERKRSRLLGDHHDRRLRLKRRRVQLPQKVDGLQVFAPAEPVRLVVWPVIVEIQHRGHRVDPDTVSMKLREPVAGIRDQKRAHLGLAVIIDPRRPVGVLVHRGVGELIAARTVKFIEPVPILRKMRRHPIENHADVPLVRLVDEILEVLRCAVPVRRRVVARDLIAPRGVVGIFHNRQQLHVRIAHVLHVGKKLASQLPEAQNASVLVPLPRARVHLVNIDRPPKDVFLSAPGSIQAVVPHKAIFRLNDTRRIRQHPAAVSVGVRLIDRPAVFCLDAELIALACLCEFGKHLPHAAADRLHRKVLLIPEVEISRHANRLRLRRPSPEDKSVYAFAHLRVAPEIPVRVRRAARVKLLQKHLKLLHRLTSFSCLGGIAKPYRRAPRNANSQLPPTGIGCIKST